MAKLKRGASALKKQENKERQQKGRKMRPVFASK